jgi:hypothetical protein
MTSFSENSRNYDDLKDLDPCSRYEIRVLIKPKHGGEERELPIFKVGPFHELDPDDMAIAKFKGDGEQHYTDNFKPEYLDITDHSFTVSQVAINMCAGDQCFCQRRK